jgi:hypothetical protein
MVHVHKVLVHAWVCEVPIGLWQGTEGYSKISAHISTSSCAPSLARRKRQVPLPLNPRLLRFHPLLRSRSGFRGILFPAQRLLGEVSRLYDVPQDAWRGREAQEMGCTSYSARTTIVGIVRGLDSPLHRDSPHTCISISSDSSDSPDSSNSSDSSDDSRPDVTRRSLTGTKIPVPP